MPFSTEDTVMLLPQVLQLDPLTERRNTLFVLCPNQETPCADW